MQRVLKSLNATILPIEDGDGHKVMDHYFAGNAPFRDAKLREDIPDAFIYFALSRMAKGKELIAVIGDKRFLGFANKLKNVTGVKDLHNLYKMKILKPALDVLELAKLWTPQKKREAISLLQANEKSLRIGLSALVVEELAGETVEDDQIPEDNRTAYVAGVHAAEEIIFDWEQIEEYGPGLLIVPISFECELDLEFSIYGMDTFSVPEWVHVFQGDFEHNRYFEACGTRNFEFEGLLSIRFSTDELETSEVVMPDNLDIETIDEYRILLDEGGSEF